MQHTSFATDAGRTTDWRNFASVYRRLGPPLRPSPSDVAVMREAMGDAPARVLLLGVTPELSVLGSELIAVDSSPRMLADVWPGDRHDRRAVLADWTRLPAADASVDVLVGDGSLNSAPAHTDALLHEIRRVLAPGGKAILRVFCSPEEAESLQSIRDDVASAWSGNLHALKWRIAMALAATAPRATVPVQAILAAFDELFPDRAQLAALTGWSMDEIATLDAYSGAGHSLAFPTLPRVLELAARYFSNVSVKHGEGYPLAERCPTVIWTVD